MLVGSTQTKSYAMKGYFTEPQEKETLNVLFVNVDLKITLCLSLQSRLYNIAYIYDIASMERNQCYTFSVKKNCVKNKIMYLHAVTLSNLYIYRLKHYKYN